MGRTLIGLIFVSVVFAGLGALGWYFVKDEVRIKPEYRLAADKISVSPAPPWVPKQFVEDVLQNSRLNQTSSLLDKALPQKLTEAFAAYPWVENVEQVVPRHPSGAEVKLSYRTPVAFVEGTQHGTFLVDRNGVLLPPQHLLSAMPDQRGRYLTIQGIQSMPPGSVGTPWGDPMVQTAAQLAEAMMDITEKLDLTHIIPEKNQSGPGIIWRLRTAAGTEIRWGTFAPNDPKTDTKKRRLWDLSEQFRSLDNTPVQSQPIDLRE